MVSLQSLLSRVTGSPRGKQWSLQNKDDPGLALQGQFAPADYTENAGAKIPEVSTVNNAEPFPQWVGGEGETSTFTARIYRPDPLAAGSVRKDVESLKRATRKDPKLHRAPLFRFQWGAEIQFDCFVVSVGGIKYDEITDTGLIKGAQFQLVLRRIDKIPQQGFSKLSDITGLTTGLKTISDVLGDSPSLLINIFGGSLHKKGKTIKAKEGDTFESIAQLEYGDPLVGDILRRAQPEKANLVPGDEVILVDNTEIFQVKVTPQSTALKDNESARRVRQAKFGERNRKIVKVF